jgi:type VI secretion system protein ImpJ
LRNLTRVVWSEGMYLGPHHFQTDRKYFENCIHFANDSLWFAPWGLAGYELDREALRNGTASLVHARGVFPEGLAFQIPECDTPPMARSITDAFPPIKPSAILLLAIPKVAPSGKNCVLPADLQPGDVRFTAEERPLFDESTGQDQRPVFLARKNLRLILDTEPLDGLEVIPLARIIRDGTGFAVDEQFIPPCLNITASSRLMLICRQLMEILTEKSRVLASANTGMGDLAGGIAARQVANFWFGHAVNTALASLRHLGLTKHGHPEELFRILSTLGGALCTFGLDSQPVQLPLYDHLNLTEIFDSLDRHIKDHLELLQPTNCVSIPLKAAAKYMYEGDIKDDRCLNRARWILAIRSPIGEASLISMTPRLAKVCSARFVAELVRRALPGMALTHLPVPPAALSPRVDFQYFGVNRDGPCWDDIGKVKKVGVYVPGDLPDPEVELFALLES